MATAPTYTERAHEVLAPVDRLIDTDAAATMTGLSPRTLRTWRSDGSGRGPGFVHVGTAVRYRVSDVQTWISRLS